MKYIYNAIVDDVYDGDTVTCTFDLGLDTYVARQRIRLKGINAPEIRGKTKEQGRAARDFLRGLVLGREVRIQTYRDRKGKYGRYLGTIWLHQPATPDKKAYWLDVNHEMIMTKHAVPYL